MAENQWLVKYIDMKLFFLCFHKACHDPFTYRPRTVLNWNLSNRTVPLLSRYKIPTAVPAPAANQHHQNGRIPPTVFSYHHNLRYLLFPITLHLSARSDP